MKNRRALAVGLLAAIGLTGACGGGNSDSDSAGAPASANASGTSEDAGRKVAISVFQFAPKTVTLKVGERITWTNEDDILHTVTSGTRTYDPADSGKVTATSKDGMFDLPMDGRGKSASFTFTKAGTFHYFCDRHPGMEADVTVQ